LDIRYEERKEGKMWPPNGVEERVGFVDRRQTGCVGVVVASTSTSMSE